MSRKYREVERSYKDLLLIIDGSNLSHRAYQKFKAMKGPSGEGTGMIFGFMRILGSYIEKFRPTQIVVCFDTHESKQANFRNKLIEGYKGHRVNLGMDYEDFNNQTKEVVKLLGYLEIPVVIDHVGLGFEADDYVARCAYLYTGGFKKKNHVIIVSSDKDFCQLITKKVKVYNPYRDILISTGTCKKYMNYTPEECVDYLSLLGDKSDDIKGYAGIGEVKARAFLDECISIKNFLNDKTLSFKGIDRVALRVLYRRNRRLISLIRTAKRIREMPIQKGKYNPEQFIKTALIHGMRSIGNQNYVDLFDIVKPLDKTIK